MTVKQNQSEISIKCGNLNCGNRNGNWWVWLWLVNGRADESEVKKTVPVLQQNSSEWWRKYTLNEWSREWEGGYVMWANAFENTTTIYREIRKKNEKKINVKLKTRVEFFWVLRQRFHFTKNLSSLYHSLVKTPNTRLTLFTFSGPDGGPATPSLHLIFYDSLKRCTRWKALFYPKMSLFCLLVIFPFAKLVL